MKHKLNFQSPLHLACSNDLFKTNLHYIHFQEGYAWATNDHILVRQSLSNFHNFDEAKIEILNGKQLHKDVYKLILRHDFINIKHEGIAALIHGHEILFRWPSNPETPPDYKQAIESSVKETEPVGKIGVNVKYLDVISKILIPYNNEVRLTFTKQNKAIFVSSNIMDIKDNFGLIMPVMLGDSLYENAAQNINSIL